MKFKQKIASSLATLVVAFSALFVFTAPAYAQRYDCGTYGADSFSAVQDCSDGELNNTGEALKYAIPALLVIGGVVILYRLNRKKPPKDKR